MKIIISEKEKRNVNGFLEWIVLMLGYTLVLTSVSIIFKSIEIDSFFYGLLATVIIYVLNKTIKPLIVLLTLPITGLTLGLFFPFINLFMLKLMDWILGSHVNINGFWSALFIAILISIMNYIMESLIIKPLLTKKGK